MDNKLYQERHLLLVSLWAGNNLQSCNGHAMDSGGQAKPHLPSEAASAMCTAGNLQTVDHGFSGSGHKTHEERQ